MIFSNIQSQYIKTLLQQNLRPDSRQPFQYRNINIQHLTKRGHLIFSIGNTQSTFSITNQIISPNNNNQSQGSLIFKIDCQSCKGTIDQNRKLSSQLVKTLERLIIGCNAVDPQSLCIITGKSVWQLKVDITVINDDGNIFDCVLNGVLLALMDMRLPMLKANYDGKGSPFIDKYQPLSIAHYPFVQTFGLYDNCILLDASGNQQKVIESRMTIGVNIYGEVCMIYKVGGMTIKTQILQGAVKICQNRIKQLNKRMKQLSNQRQNTQK